MWANLILVIQLAFVWDLFLWEQLLSELKHVQQPKTLGSVYTQTLQTYLICCYIFSELTAAATIFHHSSEENMWSAPREVF